MSGRNVDTTSFEDFTGLSVWRAILVVLPALALIAVALWAALQFLQPMPPRRIVLAAGPEGSALHRIGVQYAEIVGRHGIKVDVLETLGAADNLDRLAARKEHVDVAFVLAGMASKEQAQRIVNASNLAYVPLWCLARSASGDVTLDSLKGKRLAIGVPGSGLHAWLLPLLALNGVSSQNSALQHLTPRESIQALAAGTVDAIFLGEGLHGPELMQAIDLPGVRLMSFPRAEAYARRFPNIMPLHLPAGTLDLARDIPDRDIALIGTSVMLAARTEVHPTVVDLFVDAARTLHASQGVFEKRGEFPNLNLVDEVPVSTQAQQYAKDGPSLLRRYLPLWAADALQRVLIVAVPLFAVALPIVRYLPSLADLVGRRHQLLAYARLRRIDRGLRGRRPGEPVDDLLQQLDRIEESITGIRESVFRAGDLYTIRVHLRVVRESVLLHAGRTAAGKASAPSSGAALRN